MQTLSLNGSWELRRSDGNGEVIPAIVPGCVHTDLQRVGVIGDPNWRDNELAVAWVGKTAWTYARTFFVTADMLGHDEVILRAEGLDTLADVVLNGTPVASVDNQHITWEWDVKSLLHEGSNALEVRFVAPDSYLEEHGKIDPLRAWNEYHGYKHRGWLRKAQNNFGWDSSPVMVTCGIWRPMTLVAWSAARLVDVVAWQNHADDGSGAVTVMVGLETSAPVECIANIDVVYDGKSVGASEILLTNGVTDAAAGIGIANPQLWWPNGLGDRPLYSVTVTLTDVSGAKLDSWTRRIGLRTLTLARRPDRWGELFQFECNGVPFFAKGSNWPSPLPTSAWPEGDDWKQLLRDAAVANMNMMRMWGGAYFAPDEFFDLCDELGLTVWQDFLFACGPYPAFNDRFLASVEKEVRDNVRRMRHHPCMALWCGNNELEPSFVGPERKDMQMARADYDKIFNGILPRVVSELSPQISYWPASPMHTIVAWPDDTIPMGARSGDEHIWEIWHSDAPFENYRNYPNRFISEFGFQSFPDPKTIATYTLPDERQVNSPIMEFHQRSQPGNALIHKYTLQWFRQPAKLDDLIRLSQLTQAIAVKIGVEHWRRNMPQTMGALYWQLNDCWPAPTWSSIDFYGRWKALHYFAKRFFAPVLITGLEDAEAGTVDIHLTNDLRHDVSGDVRWTATTLDGVTVDEGCWNVIAPAGTSIRAGVAELGEVLTRYGKDNVLAWLDFVAADSDANAESHNLVTFVRIVRLPLQSPGIHFDIQPNDNGTFVITVTADKPALWAWLDTTEIDTRFTDNYRSLRPGDTWSVVATPSRKVTADEFAKQLFVRDVHATYAP